MTNEEFEAADQALRGVEAAVKEAREKLIALRTNQKVDELRAKHVAYATLVRALPASQRRMLEVLTPHDRLAQTDYESALGVTPFQLRSWLGGLSKTCKHVGVPYPIVTSGTNRRVRVFSLPLQLRTILQQQA
jgi:hypothetical protein